MSNKPQEEQNNDEIDLDKALDEFDNADLNLTNEQPKANEEEDPEMEKKIKQEYQNFMNQMKNLGMSGTGQDEGLDNLTNMLGGLLKNLSSEAGLQGSQNEIGKGFEEMFKNLKEDNVQDAASKLLNQFMNKDLLYEPLLEAKQHYEQFFSKQSQKTTPADKQRYQKQYQILKQILETLQKEPEQKDKLIDMFEKMQEYGNPPEGIASTTSFM